MLTDREIQQRIEDKYLSWPDNTTLEDRVKYLYGLNWQRVAIRYARWLQRAEDEKRQYEAHQKEMRSVSNMAMQFARGAML